MKMWPREEGKAINKTNSWGNGYFAKTQTRILREWLQIYSKTYGIITVFKTNRAVINVLTGYLINGSSKLE